MSRKSGSFGPSKDLPLVAGIGAGGELHRPLAIAVVGGLAFSTAATLFLVPLLSSLQRRRH